MIDFFVGYDFIPNCFFFTPSINFMWKDCQKCWRVAFVIGNLQLHIGRNCGQQDPEPTVTVIELSEEEGLKKLGLTKEQFIEKYGPRGGGKSD